MCYLDIIDYRGIERKVLHEVVLCVTVNYTNRKINNKRAIMLALSRSLLIHRHHLHQNEREREISPKHLTIVTSMSIVQGINRSSEIVMELVVTSILGPSDRLQLSDNVCWGTGEGCLEIRGHGGVLENVELVEQCVDGREGRSRVGIIERDDLVAASDVLVSDRIGGLGTKPAAGVKLASRWRSRPRCGCRCGCRCCRGGSGESDQNGD